MMQDFYKVVKNAARVYKLDKIEFTNLRSDFLRNNVNIINFIKYSLRVSQVASDPWVLMKFCELLGDSYEKFKFLTIKNCPIVCEHFSR